MSFSERFINVLDREGALAARDDFAANLDEALRTAPRAVVCVESGRTLTVLGPVDLAIEPRFTLSRSRPGISARTLIFGLQALALLLLAGATGCDPSAAAQRDATAPSDLTASDLTGSDLSVTDDLAVWDDAQELATMDSGPALDASLLPDASPVLDAAQGVDAVVPSDVFNPRQSRARCVETPSGDSSISAPRLIFPMTAMRVTSHRPTLQWSLPPGVTGARVELCRDRCCTQPIASFDAVGDRGRPAQALPPGVVFWRVRGMVGARVGRETSFTWEFGVRHRDTPEDTAWGTLKDFNGDGFDDIVMDLTHDRNRMYTDVIRVVYGQSGYRVDNYAEIESPFAGGLSVGDYNGDGLADVALCSVGHVGVVPLYGTTRGIVLRGMQLPWASYCVDSADFNGDGFSDLACREDRSGPFVSVYYGSADGLSVDNRRLYASSVAESPTWPSYPSVSSVADLDADGYSDFLLAYRVSDGSLRRYEVVRGSSTEMRRDDVLRLDFDGAGGPESLDAVRTVGDTNGDRVYDFMHLSRRRTALYESISPRRFRASDELAEVVPRLFVGGIETWFTTRLPDMNADGRPEVITICPFCGQDGDAGTSPSFGRVWIHWSNGVEPRRREEVPGPADACSRFGYVANSVGDFNGDGFDELLVADLRASSCRDYDPRQRFTMLWGGGETRHDPTGWIIEPPDARGTSFFAGSYL